MTHTNVYLYIYIYIYIYIIQNGSPHAVRPPWNHGRNIIGSYHPRMRMLRTLCGNRRQPLSVSYIYIYVMMKEKDIRNLYFFAFVTGERNCTQLDLSSQKVSDYKQMICRLIINNIEKKQTILSVKVFTLQYRGSFNKNTMVPGPSKLNHMNTCVWNDGHYIEPGKYADICLLMLHSRYCFLMPLYLVASNIASR